VRYSSSPLFFLCLGVMKDNSGGTRPPFFSLLSPERGGFMPSTAPTSSARTNPLGPGGWACLCGWLSLFFSTLSLKAGYRQLSVNTRCLWPGSRSRMILIPPCLLVGPFERYVYNTSLVFLFFFGLARPLLSSFLLSEIFGVINLPPHISSGIVFFYAISRRPPPPQPQNPKLDSSNDVNRISLLF